MRRFLLFISICFFSACSINERGRVGFLGLYLNDPPGVIDVKLDSLKNAGLIRAIEEVKLWEVNDRDEDYVIIGVSEFFGYGKTIQFYQRSNRCRLSFGYRNQFIYIITVKMENAEYEDMRNLLSEKYGRPREAQFNYTCGQTLLSRNVCVADFANRSVIKRDKFYGTAARWSVGNDEVLCIDKYVDAIAYQYDNDTFIWHAKDYMSRFAGNGVDSSVDGMGEWIYNFATPIREDLVVGKDHSVLVCYKSGAQQAVADSVSGVMNKIKRERESEERDKLKSFF